MRHNKDADEWFHACFGKPKPEEQLYHAAGAGDCKALKRLLASGVWHGAGT